MSIEFMPWYVPGDVLVRCGGDGGCGNLVGDTHQHLKFHERLDKMEALAVRIQNRLDFPENHTRVLGKSEW